MKIIPLTVFLAVSGVMVGCDTGSVSEYDMPTSENVPTAKETVTNWLKGVAEAGELDSGAEVMGEKFEELAQDDVDLTDEFEKLKNEKSESAIRSQAKSMLEKLE